MVFALRPPTTVRTVPPTRGTPVQARPTASFVMGLGKQSRNADASRSRARWRVNSTQQAQQQSEDGWRPGRQLFGRAAELRWMEDSCRYAPGSIQVLVGPCNCGISAVLHEFSSRNPNVMHVDCRDYDTSSPAQLLAAVLSRALRRGPGTLQEQMVDRVFNSGPNTELLLGKLEAAASISRAVKFQLNIGDLGGLLQSLLWGPSRKGTPELIFREIRCARVGACTRCQLAAGQPWRLGALWVNRFGALQGGG